MARARRLVLADHPAVRVLDGVACLGREDLAVLAGWPPGNSVHVRARTDPTFPAPLHGRRIAGRYWYPVTDVETYLSVLAQRAIDKKPPPAKPGDPDELLAPADAATVLHLAASTFRHYVRLSRPYWDGEITGRPMLPPPDVETETPTARGRLRVKRSWYRRTLATHQTRRPGPGTGAGRPRNQPPDPA